MSRYRAFSGSPISAVSSEVCVPDVIIDLWPSRFGIDASGDAVWNPRSLYLRWDPEFREGLCNVYAGFFLDQQERLKTGPRQLGPGPSAHPLLQHLGEGNQRSVRFDRSKLESTLKAMSAGRRPHRERLHRNFIAFGLYVTSLHELLASLELAFDARSAFMRSHAELRPGSTLCLALKARAKGRLDTTSTLSDMAGQAYRETPWWAIPRACRNSRNTRLAS